MSPVRVENIDGRMLGDVIGVRTTQKIALPMDGRVVSSPILDYFVASEACPDKPIDAIREVWVRGTVDGGMLHIVEFGGAEREMTLKTGSVKTIHPLVFIGLMSEYSTTSV